MATNLPTTRQPDGLPDFTVWQSCGCSHELTTNTRTECATHKDWEAKLLATLRM